MNAIGEMRQLTLSVRNATVRYQGVHALEKVSIDVRPDRITGLIGPNGAGKTTLFNAVAGLTPSEGSITLEGTECQGLRAERRARLGLARSFQTPRVVEEISVLDNVMAGALTRSTRPILRGTVRTRQQRRDLAQARERADAQIRAFGLEKSTRRRAGELNHPERRRVELARALAAEPVLLLLDEPAAGMGIDDALQLFDAIRAGREQQLSILLVEHSVDLVTRLASYVYALDAGRNLAEGPPEQIVTNQAVISAYLGRATVGRE